jgi:SNF2 family DNA or RNA helicase
MVAATESALYPYQERAVKFLEYRKGCAGLFMEMGTGKTRVALTFAHRQRYARVLIVCPLSVAGVWQREIRKLELDVAVHNLTTGSTVQRAQMVTYVVEDWAKYTDRPQYVIVNYESYWRMPLREALQKWRPDAIILDEAHRIKGRTTRQSKFAHALASIATCRLALTGTPITGGIQDLFSIYKFIDNRVFGNRYADFEWRYIQKGGFQGYSIIGYRNVEEVERKVRESAFQISKAEALDLPERVDVSIPVTLESKTRKKYDEFRKHAIAEMEGTDDDGMPRRGTALAKIVLTAILRLQQIANGFVTDDTGETIFLSEEKVKACQEIVESALEDGHQIVVFCRFLKDLSRLAEHLPSSSLIYGEVKQQERDRRIEAFAKGDIRVLICQIQTASLGIDLVAADIGIFYSTGFSLSDFLQARDRIHRHGQTKKVTYYHLLAEKSVDEQVFQALIDKQQIAAKVVDLDYTRRLLA